MHLNWARTISFQDVQLTADQVCYSIKKTDWLEFVNRFAALSSLLGGLCAQPGVLCLQRLDLRFDLPLERAAPLGKLRLAQHL